MSMETSDQASAKPTISSDTSQQDADLVIKIDDSDIRDIQRDDMSTLDITTDTNDTKEDTKTKTEEISDQTVNTDNIQNDLNSGGSKPSMHVVWVSNITRDIKASDLKKLFSPAGKILSMKILTNGIHLYGYAQLNSAEVANKCIRDFHNTILKGQKLSLSRNRPDVIGKTAEADKNYSDKTQKEAKLDKQNKAKDASKEIKPKSIESNIVENKANSNETEKSNAPAIGEKDIKLKRKIDTLYTENSKLQRRLDDTIRLYNSLNLKYNSLKRELKKSHSENREERKKISTEKQNFEKQKKLELSRLAEERTSLRKELVEANRLTDKLRFKLDEIKYQTVCAKRGRSPSERALKSPRRRSSPDSRGNADSYRDDEKPEKKFRRSEGFSRERTPPAPNLNSEIGKRPISARTSTNPPGRSTYFSTGIKPSNSGYMYHQSCVFDQSNPKNNWMGSYSKDQRRGNTASNQETSLPRYNGPTSSAYPPSTVQTPRGNNHYYQHW